MIFNEATSKLKQMKTITIIFFTNLEITYTRKRLYKYFKFIFYLSTHFTYVHINTQSHSIN